MEITFKTNKLQKKCDSDSALVKAYGQECARKITRRLDDLLDMTCLEEMRPPFPGRCHELKGDRKGQFALDVKHPLRLIFKPANLDVKMKEEGGLDWTSVTAVQIIEVEDYHD